LTETERVVLLTEKESELLYQQERVAALTERGRGINFTARAREGSGFRVRVQGLELRNWTAPSR